MEASTGIRSDFLDREDSSSWNLSLSGLSKQELVQRSDSPYRKRNGGTERVGGLRWSHSHQLEPSQLKKTNPMVTLTDKGTQKFPTFYIKTQTEPTASGPHWAIQESLECPGPQGHKFQSCSWVTGRDWLALPSRGRFLGSKKNSSFLGMSLSPSIVCSLVEGVFGGVSEASEMLSVDSHHAAST